MERTHQNFIEVPLNCAGTSSSSSPRSTMNLQSYKAWIPTHNGKSGNPNIYAIFSCSLFSLFLSTITTNNCVFCLLCYMNNTFLSCGSPNPN
ncbi:hypothetical protein CsatA_003741 [Cannabis sativa]